MGDFRIGASGERSGSLSDAPSPEIISSQSWGWRKTKSWYRGENEGQKRNFSERQGREKPRLSW